MRSHPRKQSQSFEERRKRRTWVGVVAGVLALTSWTFAMSRLSFLPYFSLDDIQIYGVAPEVAGPIRAAASSTLNGTYLGIFSKSNTVLYPKSDIIAAVSSASPVVNGVDVERDGSHNLIITVREKAADAVVCADLPDLSDTDLTASISSCFVTDRTGYIYRRASGDEISTLGRYYIPGLKVAEAVGSLATTTSVYTKFGNLTKDLAREGIFIVGILISDKGELEVYAKNPDSEDIVVIHFDMGRLDLERDNLILFWRKMTLEAKAKHKKIDWEEIRLSFPPNVYFTENSAANDANK